MDDIVCYRSYETFVGISPPILGSLRRQGYYEVSIICIMVKYLVREVFYDLKLTIETSTSE